MIENLNFSVKSREEAGRRRGAGPGPKVAAGWSSSTNCSPAASASTGEQIFTLSKNFKTREYGEIQPGTEPQSCYHANTATASTPAWKDWWTMSRNRYAR